MDGYIFGFLLGVASGLVAGFYAGCRAGATWAFKRVREEFGALASRPPWAKK